MNPSAKPPAKTTYYILLGVIVLAIIAVGVAVYSSTNMLQKKSQDVRKARLRNAVVEQNQTILRKAKADIEHYKDLAKVASEIVPQDKDQTQTVREISNLAAQQGVILGAITFPASSLGDPKATLSQLTPVKGIAGVYILPITVRSDAKIPSDYANFIKFLDALEHNRRTALVVGIDLQPQEKKPNKVFFTLTIQEYIKP